jgi:hypothetical protein
MKITKSTFRSGANPPNGRPGGRIPLELIEIRAGSYLGEDDIVRIEMVIAGL